MKNLTKTIMAMGMLTVFTSCSGGGGGGGGSSPSYSPPSYVKPAKIKCGNKDCVSGAAVSLASKSSIQPMSTWGDHTLSVFKTQYDTAKLVVANTNSVIEQLNLMAEDNSIASCDDIPTSGNFSFGGWDYELGGHHDSFDIGNGLVSTDHSLKGSNAQGDKIFISFKCGTTQSIHIITKGNIGNLAEVYYDVNTSTNATTILYGQNMGGMNTYGYFKNDGADVFTFGLFLNNPAGNGPNAYIAGTKSYTSNTGAIFPATEYLEIGYTSISGQDIDAVAIGGDSISYRGCVSQYRGGSPFTADSSCSYMANPVSGDQNQINFTTSLFPANILGNASVWSTDDVKTLVITDPDTINL